MTAENSNGYEHGYGFGARIGLMLIIPIVAVVWISTAILAYTHDGKPKTHEVSQPLDQDDFYDQCRSEYIQENPTCFEHGAQTCLNQIEEKCSL